MPDSALKLIPTQILTSSAFRLHELLFNLKLGRNAGVIRPGHPQSRPPSHPMVPDHQVLDGHKHRMAKVKLSSDIRRGHGDDEGLLLGLDSGPKIALSLPPFVQPLLRGLEVIGLWKGKSHDVVLLDGVPRSLK